jgi:7-cyano-7-deazaguanine synthase in queuosine biosynthesis
MTIYYLRTRPTERVPLGGVLLDWFGRGGSSTVSAEHRDLLRSGDVPDPLTLDLLRLAITVHSADKLDIRDDTRDCWTRSLQLRVAVSDPARWRAGAPAFERALKFLTNDAWSLRLRSDGDPGGPGTQLFAADAVCLFSGGLDSLVGAIDLLEAGRRVLLVGHYDSNPLLPRQVNLFERLRDHYGLDRLAHRPFYLRHASPNARQARPLPSRRESTTRSRSFLFIAAAAVVASAHGLDRIYMPENGYIGLNVPLEASRLGACSTRTTHPHFMALLREAFDEVAIPIAIENPLRLKTKAEVLRDCRNPALLARLAEDSVSCAHPEVGRWTGDPYRNCGYCYPCLMRRVSLHGLAADDAGRYRFDVGDPAFLAAGGSRTGHLRALIANVLVAPRSSDALRSGPLPRAEAKEFVDLYLRGRAEISAWLREAVPGSA